MKLLEDLDETNKRKLFSCVLKDIDNAKDLEGKDYELNEVHCDTYNGGDEAQPEEVQNSAYHGTDDLNDQGDDKQDKTLVHMESDIRIISSRIDKKRNKP